MLPADAPRLQGAALSRYEGIEAYGTFPADADARRSIRYDDHVVDGLYADDLPCSS
jgi:hypothetical protein